MTIVPLRFLPWLLPFYDNLQIIFPKLQAVGMKLEAGITTSLLKTTDMNYNESAKGDRVTWSVLPLFAGPL